MPSSLAAFFHEGDATELPVEQRRWLFAARAWIMAARSRRNPRPYVARELGVSSAAASFGLLMDGTIQAWPEPFAVCRMHCPCLRVDERLLVDMLAAAEIDNRAGFDRLLREMLPRATRDNLYSLAMRVHANLQGRML